MIMRKSIILLALILGGLTANAQSVVEGTKVTDNWSVEVNGRFDTQCPCFAFAQVEVEIQSQTGRPSVLISITIHIIM